MQTRFQRILECCEPFLISYPENWPEFELAPCGIEIPPHRRFTATTLESREVIDGLYRLDGATFGDQNMQLPRWVFFDCGAFPGIVFGFGCQARKLPGYVRDFYDVADHDDAFVPLSMWIAIRCAQESSWFGHNLSSANLILRGNDAMPGLALLTKCFGTIVARVDTMYGATQWRSESIGIHQKLGQLEILSAYTPAHTHLDTFAYRILIDRHRLRKQMHTGFECVAPKTTRSFPADDSNAMRALQSDIERGKRYFLVRADVKRNQDGLVHLSRI